MDTFNILMGLLLGLTAIAGDQLVLLNRNNDVTRALSDNITHAAIGFITWVNVQSHLRRGTLFHGEVLLQGFVCSLISSAIDVDHFIAAQSLHLKDATKLSRRPFLHCTTIPLVLSTVALLLAHYLHSTILDTFGWILLASFLSHHVRDAARRGMWLWPFGSTPPLGNPMYLCLTVLLPFILASGIILTNVSISLSRPHHRPISVV